mmetsp:Transcript_101231/g.287022  ORF Transcript_101231/g.287022 Transcript_101231/m.287022 type:complete len:278 (-) Transcript_101231:347-1180(-)
MTSSMPLVFLKDLPSTDVMIQPVRTPAFAAWVPSTTPETTSPFSWAPSRMTRPMSVLTSKSTVRCRSSSGPRKGRTSAKTLAPPLRFASETTQPGQDAGRPSQCGAGRHLRAPVLVPALATNPLAWPWRRHILSWSSFPKDHHAQPPTDAQASAQASLLSVGNRSDFAHVALKQSKYVLTSYFTVSVAPAFLALSKSSATSLSRSVGLKGRPSISLIIQPFRTPARRACESGRTSRTTSPSSCGSSSRAMPTFSKELNVIVRWRTSSGWLMNRRTSA